MFERFTERARHVVVLAQEEARLLNHNYIGTEHILLGLIHERGGVAARVITSAGLSLEAARAEVEQIIGLGKSTPTGHVPFTPRAKKILELSLRESLEQQKTYINTEHILLALVREGQGVGAQILVTFFGSDSAIRQRVLAAANDPAPDDVADLHGAGDPQPGAASETITGRTAGGPLPFDAWGRSIRVQATAVRELRDAITAIDRRLAAIERHLGTTLAAIDRHLGIAAEPSADSGPVSEPAAAEPAGQPEDPQEAAE